MRDFGSLSPKQDVFIKPLPSNLRDLCRKGGGKSIRDRIWVTPKKQCLADISGLIRIGTQRDCGSTNKPCTVKPAKSQQASRHKALLLTRKLFKLIPARKRKIGVPLSN